MGGSFTQWKLPYFFWSPAREAFLFECVNGAVNRFRRIPPISCHSPLDAVQKGVQHKQHQGCSSR
jgi:hypothetical protein